MIEQVKRMRVPVPCVTFDQPLWLKACGIIEEAGLDIVARLGGFHTLMSYLGAIGKVMKGFRIEELFNEVYAENTVQHISLAKPFQERYGPTCFRNLHLIPSYLKIPKLLTLLK